MKRSQRTLFWLCVAIVLVIALASIPACTMGATPKTSPPVALMSLRGGVIAKPLQVPAAKTPPVPYRINRGPNTTKYVVATYDDCPRSIKAYRAMVDYASSNDNALVLFPTGECIKSYKARGFNLVGYARDRGIWVANHSYSHPNLTQLSIAAIVREIRGTAVSNYGRPPYGAINDAVRDAYKRVTTYDRHGMRIWTWTVDTLDWKALKSGARPSSSLIVARALATTKPGGTILMHMQHNGFNPKTLRALEKGLAKKGLKLCRAWHGEDRTGPIEATGRVIPRNIC